MTSMQPNPGRNVRELFTNRRFSALNRAGGRRYQENTRAQLFQGTMNVREGARRGGGKDPLGKALVHFRKWGPLVLVLLAADGVVATSAWFLVGLFLR
jgi:hypothetical protein